MEASIGMVFQVCFWERRKLQLVAACASKPVVVRYFLLHVGTIEVQVCDRNLCHGKWHWARLGVCHIGKFNIPGTKTSEDLIEY